MDSPSDPGSSFYSNLCSRLLEQHFFKSRSLISSTEVRQRGETLTLVHNMLMKRLDQGDSDMVEHYARTRSVSLSSLLRKISPVLPSRYIEEAGASPYQFIFYYDSHDSRLRVCDDSLVLTATLSFRVEDLTGLLPGDEEEGGEEYQRARLHFLSQQGSLNELVSWARTLGVITENKSREELVDAITLLKGWQ